MKIKKPKKKIKPLYLCIGISVVFLIGAVVFARIKALQREQIKDTVKTGAAYENYDGEKALAIITEFMDDVANKEIDKLQDVFYTEDLLKTFAEINEVTEEQIITDLKNNLKDATLEYKNLKIEDYSAYQEGYYQDTNDEIKVKTGKENYISALYSVNISYFMYSIIGWEEKTETIMLYVNDGEYRIWPNLGKVEGK